MTAAPKPRLVTPMKPVDDIAVARQRMKHLRPWGVRVRPVYGLALNPERTPEEQRRYDERLAMARRVAKRVMDATLLISKPPSALD